MHEIPKGTAVTSGKLGMLPLMQSKLENYFTDSMFMTYTHHELMQIIKRYQQSRDHANEELGKILENIIGVLNATNNFLNSSTQETVFKKMRESKNEHELREVLTNIENAFLQAQENLKETCTNQHFSDTYSNCIDYCKECVIKRVRELEIKQDKIYNIYLSHTLKNKLEPNQITPQNK